MQVINTGIGTAVANMHGDECLLQELDSQGDPILHLYEWKDPAATFGYFIDPEKHLDLGRAKKLGVDLARRPTGGGIVFHIWDLAFSFLMPSGHPCFSLGTLDNYRFVNGVVLDVIRKAFDLPGELTPEDGRSLGSDCRNFCMAKPTQYDVVHQGMKVAGAAQRRRKQGYLHQGTISLAVPQFDLLHEILLSKEEVLNAMKAFTFAPLGSLWTPAQLAAARKELEALLIDQFTLRLKV